MTDDAERLAHLGKFVENVAANEGWANNDTVLELLAIARRAMEETAHQREAFNAMQAAYRAEGERAERAEHFKERYFEQCMELERERNAARAEGKHQKDRAEIAEKIAEARWHRLEKAESDLARLQEAAGKAHEMTTGHGWAKPQPFEKCDHIVCLEARKAALAGDGKGGASAETEAVRPRQGTPAPAKPREDGEHAFRHDWFCTVHAAYCNPYRRGPPTPGAAPAKPAKRPPPRQFCVCGVFIYEWLGEAHQTNCPYYKPAKPEPCPGIKTCEDLSHPNGHCPSCKGA